MKCLAPWSALLAVLVLANSLQLCVSTLEAIKGIHRGGPAVAVGPDMATGDGRKLHRPVAEVEKELAMVSRRPFPWYTAKKPARRPGDPAK